jgi:RNA polymerase sigma factor (sigma-70 family)
VTSESHDITGDRALIARCAAGDGPSWEEFTRRYGPIIRRTAQAVRDRLGAWRVEVDDMVGHVYEHLLKDDCRRLRQWRGEARLRTFLIHLTRNASIDYLRIHNRGREIALSDAGDAAEQGRRVDPVFPDAEGETSSAQRLHAALQALPPQQLLIIQLRLASISLRDIARMLGLPQGTVFAQSTRAIERLRNLMTTPDPPVSGGETR